MLSRPGIKTDYWRCAMIDVKLLTLLKVFETGNYTRIGGWWDRKGENEMDLVCENEFANILDFFEVKREPSRIDIAALQKKGEAFFAKNPQLAQRTVSFAGLSMLDM